MWFSFLCFFLPSFSWFSCFCLLHCFLFWFTSPFLLCCFVSYFFACLFFYSDSLHLLFLLFSFFSFLTSLSFYSNSLHLLSSVALFLTILVCLSFYSDSFHLPFSQISFFLSFLVFRFFFSAFFKTLTVFFSTSALYLLFMFTILFKLLSLFLIFLVLLWSPYLKTYYVHLSAFLHSRHIISATLFLKLHFVSHVCSILFIMPLIIYQPYLLIYALPHSFSFFTFCLVHWLCLCFFFNLF